MMEVISAHLLTHHLDFSIFYSLIPEKFSQVFLGIAFWTVEGLDERLERTTRQVSYVSSPTVYPKEFQHWTRSSFFPFQ